MRTLRPGRAHNVVSWRALAPYRGHARPILTAHWPCRWPCRGRRLPCCNPLQSRYKICIATQTSAARTARRVARCPAYHNAPTSCRRALLRRIAASSVSCRDARPAPPFMIQSFVSRHTSLTRPRALALQLALVRWLAVSWPCWPCRGAVSHGYWPYRGHLLHAPARLCHDTVCCIVTKHN